MCIAKRQSYSNSAFNLKLESNLKTHQKYNSAEQYFKSKTLLFYSFLDE